MREDEIVNPTRETSLRGKKRERRPLGALASRDDEIGNPRNDPILRFAFN